MKKQGILILLSLLTWQTFAQSLTGRINSTKEKGIAGASVAILNSNLGASTNQDGNFAISNLSKGVYTVHISAVGFAAKTTTVEITENKNYVVAIQLAESINALDEVVVSAEKSEQKAQRVPVAISTITSKQVSNYRLWNLKEVMGIVPNFYSESPGDDKNVASIRGITSASYDQPIAVYLDGVNQFRLSTCIPQLVDIERIEVLRGSQGTLYGRNAMGGVINIITKQPSNQTAGFAELSAGSFGTQRYSVGFKTPLVKNKLFAGISYLYDKRDGYYTNLYNHASFDNYSSVTGNYYIKWIASPKFSATFNVKHFNRRNKGSYPLIPFANASVDSLRFKVNYNAIAQDIDNTLYASAVLNHYGDKVDITAISGYQVATRYYSGAIDADVQLPFKFQSADVNAIEISPDNGQNTIKVFSQEVRVNSAAKSESPLKWTAGVYYFNQHYPTKQSLLAGADAGKFGQPGAPYKVVTTTNSASYGYALFGQATYQFSEKLSLTAGLRYDYESQNLTVGSQFVKGTFVNTTLKDTTGSTNFDAISPKVTLSYKKAENQLVYASYSKGYRVGGLSQIGYDPSEAPLVAFKPEFSNTIEVGWKGTYFENLLRANVTLFYIDVTDAQIPTLIPSLGFRTATTNAGNFSSKGIEVELSTTPIKGLQVDLNVGTTDATYSKLSVPVTTYENGQSKKVSKDFAGNRQIQTPNYTALLAAQYNKSLGKGLEGLVRVEWRGIGKQYFDLPNLYSQDAYSLVNVRAGVSIKNYSLMFWGRNMGNTAYIAYGYNFGPVTMGAPRVIGGTLAAKF
ncbi:MAG: TonB-dependent receptor [Spirosomataceae bacterium]